MAFKTFAPGVLTSSDVNTFLMRQAVIVATSSTRPASPNEGMMIYETDTDLFAFYTGAAWEYVGGATAFTPTITSAGWAIGNGVVSGSFGQLGKYVFGRYSITFGSTSTFGAAALDVALPTAAVNSSLETLGVGLFEDISSGSGFQLNIQRSGTNFRNNLYTHNNVFNYTTSTALTSTVPVTISGTDADRLGVSFFYQRVA